MVTRLADIYESSIAVPYTQICQTLPSAFSSSPEAQNDQVQMPEAEGQSNVGELQNKSSEYIDKCPLGTCQHDCVQQYSSSSLAVQKLSRDALPCLVARLEITSYLISLFTYAYACFAISTKLADLHHTHKGLRKLLR
ncbi:MAG: hypothetical protein AAGG59_17505 [Bacteroidota bacterium]